MSLNEDQGYMTGSVHDGLSLFVFQLLAPTIDWLDYLSSSLSPLELNDTEPVVLYAREYLQQVSELINKTERRSEPEPACLSLTCLSVLQSPVSLS